MSETMIETCVLTLGELMSKDLGNEKFKIFSTEMQSLLNSAEKYQLAIPFYQHAYVWSEEMVKIMLEDIDEQRKESKRYLLGSLIIHIDKTDENEVKFNIVDGQQRLTTLDLVLEHLEDKLDLKKSKKYLAKSDTEQTIKQTIQNWFKSRDKNSFLEYLKNSIEFVCVFTDRLDDAFIFFDSANAKGKRLEGYDLIKAFHLRALWDTKPTQKHRETLQAKGINPYDKNELIKHYAREFEDFAKQNDDKEDTKDIKILFNETLTPARQWLRHNSSEAPPLKRSVSFLTKAKQPLANG